MDIKTKIPQCTLRGGGEADIPLILSLIRELAEYEKLLSEVTATEASLRDCLFGERRVAEVVLGEWEGRPVAMAVFFHNFSTFLGRPGIYLEDLYVKPELRGKGIGGVMLAYLAKLAVERGCGRLEWWVLDWNKPAIRFYRSLGSAQMDEWTTHRVAGDALKRLAGKF